ncbi:MAG: 50S ribosomal protein L18 [Candidatus Kerfeldbacteria bacterium]|nr:50S ribosomal protein L18 [Candidatus Kerfeldbacteria bacterium]
MKTFHDSSSRRLRRHRRVRARIFGSAARPRLAVFRSGKHISAQIIDDSAGRTLAAARDGELKKNQAATVAIAYAVGKLLAERAKKLGIKRVTFDRGGHSYHGQVQSLANGAREGGLEF